MPANGMVLFLSYTQCCSCVPIEAYIEAQEGEGLSSGGRGRDFPVLSGRSSGGPKSAVVGMFAGTANAC